MMKYFDLLKRLFLFYKDHYLFLSSAILFIFTTLCYLHTDKYFSHFDIDFLIFGGFADVYQVALSNGVLGAILFISVMTCMITIGFVFLKDAMEPKSLAFMKVILLVAATFTVYLAADLIFISGPVYDAEDVKSGFSTRFNLNAGSDQIRCQTIIGSTKEYVITWDHKAPGVKAIPRSSISRFEMAIGAPPARYLLPIDEKDEQYAMHKVNLDNQAKWFRLLMLNCNEEVEWPKIPVLPPQAK
jgi:hypothetical protein